MRFTQVQIISDKVERPCPRGDPEAHEQQPGCTFSINVPREDHAYEQYMSTTIRVNRELMLKCFSPCSVGTINGNYHFPTGFISDAEVSCKCVCHLGGLTG